MPVRKAELSDLPSIMAVWKSVRAKNGNTRPIDYSEDDFARIIADEVRALCLVYQEDNIVKGVSVTFDMITWGYMDALGIDPEQNHKGIGKAMMEANFKASVERGWKSFELCYDLENQSAANFCKSLGMAPSEIGKQGMPTQTVWLYKDIGQI